MFDKWKTKNALCKAYKLYYEKRRSYLKISTIDLYLQIQDIQYAIAYVLCKYFDFKCDNPFSYKWHITYDYTNYYNKCEEAYEKFVKENNTIFFDLVKPLKGEITDKQYGILYDGKFDYGYITTLIKGNIYFDVESNKQYMFDGKNLLEMC